MASNFKTNGVTEPPATEFCFEGDEEVIGLIFFDDEVSVSRDAEDEVVAHAHAREESVEMRCQDIFETDESLTGNDCEEAIEDIGHLHPSDSNFTGIAIVDSHEQVDGSVRDIGEWVTNVDRERREDREDVAVEGGTHRGAFLCSEVLPANNRHTCWSELLRDLGHEVILAAVEVVHLCPNGLQLLLRTKAIRRTRRHPGGNLILEVSYTDLEELIEEVCLDGQELDAIEERHRRVAREIEQAIGEVES